jgi:hypothetical protein
MTTDDSPRLYVSHVGRVEVLTRVQGDLRDCIGE